MKVSVITSVYACAKFLEKCIMTVKEQTHKDVEHILVSTGSPEEEKETEIVKRLFPLHGHDLFYHVYPEHANLTQAWNKAIVLSHGDLIVNLNSDDWFSSNALEVMSEYFEKDPNLGMVYTDLVCHSEEGGHLYYDYKREWGNSLATEWCGPMPMWRKNLHDRLGMFDEQFIHVADFDWWCRVSHHSKLQRVPHFLCHYLVRAQSLEHQGLLVNRVQTERNVVIQRLNSGYYEQPFH